MWYFFHATNGSHWILPKEFEDQIQRVPTTIQNSNRVDVIPAKQRQRQMTKIPTTTPKAPQAPPPPDNDDDNDDDDDTLLGKNIVFPSKASSKAVAMSPISMVGDFDASVVTSIVKLNRNPVASVAPPSKKSLNFGAAEVEAGVEAEVEDVQGLFVLDSPESVNKIYPRSSNNRQDEEKQKKNKLERRITADMSEVSGLMKGLNANAGAGAMAKFKPNDDESISLGDSDSFSDNSDKDRDKDQDKEKPPGTTCDSHGNITDNDDDENQLTQDSGGGHDNDNDDHVEKYAEFRKKAFNSNSNSKSKSNSNSNRVNKYSSSSSSSSSDNDGDSDDQPRKKRRSEARGKNRENAPRLKPTANAKPTVDPLYKYPKAEICSLQRMFM